MGKESLDISQSVNDFLDNELPLYLGCWFDQPTRSPEDNHRVAILTYEAFSLICPRGWADRRVWSIRSLSYGLRQTRREGQRMPESFFEAASTMVVLELFNMGLLENKKGRNFDQAVDSIYKNTLFRVKSTRRTCAQAYEYLAFLGEVARIDKSQIEDYRRIARELTE